MKIRSGIAGLLACAALTAFATTGEFPQDAAAPSAAELTDRLAGKSFAVELKNGVSWKLEYNGNGWFFVDTSTGGRSSGRWQVEDGKLCSMIKGRSTTFSCSDARVHQDRLIVRRTVDGELITLVPR